MAMLRMRAERADGIEVMARTEEHPDSLVKLGVRRAHAAPSGFEPATAKLVKALRPSGQGSRPATLFPVQRGNRLRPDLRAQRKDSVRSRASRPEGPTVNAKRTRI